MPLPVFIRRFKYPLLLAALAGTIGIFISFDTPPPRPKADVEAPVALLEDITLTSRTPLGVALTIEADKAQLKRDFSNLLSFAGQYEISVDNLQVRYDLPALTRAELTTLCATVGNNMKVYPKAWDKIGSPTYNTVTVNFTRNGDTILSVTADKATRLDGGDLMLNGISASSDHRLAHCYDINLANPFFLHLLTTNLRSHENEAS